MDDGKNVVFTFILVSSLFLLWGFCNGMIDVMDKHFQEELHLSLAQSAWVQFAHYLGYFLMALPAGLAGDQAGLQGRHHRRAADGRGGRVLVHPGDAHRAILGVPARRLHHRRRADLPGNHRQSLHHRARATSNTRPPASTWPNPATASAGSSGRSPAALFFYGKDAAGTAPAARRSGFLTRPWRWWSWSSRSFSTLPMCRTSRPRMITIWMIAPAGSHSIWTHPHFVMAVAAQFLYVAAQAGIFSFFINYMTSQSARRPGVARLASDELASWRYLVLRPGQGQAALVHLERQRRGQSRLARVLLLSRRAVHRGGDPEEILRRTRCWAFTG